MRHFLFFIISLLSATLYAQNMEPVKVIIVAGQSNTDGRVPATDFDDYISEIPNCYWRWGSAEKERTKGHFELFTPTDSKKKIFSKWAYDAFVYQEVGKAQKEPFYVVKWSQGGTAIDSLAKSSHNNRWCADKRWIKNNSSVTKGGKSLLLAFEELIDDAINKELSKLPQGYIIEAFLWHQGESDAQRGIYYYQNLKQMLQHVRTHLVEKTGDKRYRKLPFILGTVSERNKQYSKDVKDGMMKLARKDKNVHVIDVGNAELLPDQLHFTAVSAQKLGLSMAQKMRELGIY